MWPKLKPLLVILSVALNLAFVAVWVTRAVPARFGCGGPCEGPESRGPVWCPLHRKLGTTEKQWSEIEPSLAEFQKSAQELCRTIKRRRLEMIDLIAASQVDREAICGKQEEILAGQRKMQELVIEHLLSEKNMLTPKQRKALFRMFRRRTGCAGDGPMTGVGPRNGSRAQERPDGESGRHERP